MIGTVQKQPVIRIPHIQSRQTAAAQQVIGFMDKVQKIRLNGTKQIRCAVLCKQHCKETIEVQQDQCFSQNRLRDRFSPFDSGKVHSQGKIRTYQFRKNSLFGKGTLFLVSPHILPEDHTQQQINISGFLLLVGNFILICNCILSKFCIRHFA